MISDHFSEQEFRVVDAEERVQENARCLAYSVLEPLHAQAGALKLDCGYRAPEHNAAVGGVPTSYHLYLDGKAAADVLPLEHSMADAFDWLRYESHLPFDKIILECHPIENGDAIVKLLAEEANGPSRPALKDLLLRPDFLRVSPRCIHVQADRFAVARRLAYIGFTNGASNVYQQVVVNWTRGKE